MLLVRWPPTHVPVALNCAPCCAQRKPVLDALIVPPSGGQTRYRATKLDASVRTIASRAPPTVTSARPPVAASAG